MTDFGMVFAPSHAVGGIHQACGGIPPNWDLFQLGLRGNYPYGLFPMNEICHYLLDSLLPENSDDLMYLMEIHRSCLSDQMMKVTILLETGPSDHPIF